jgi:glycosyltransferase involved in cell wall biosynthesis
MLAGAALERRRRATVHKLVTRSWPTGHEFPPFAGDSATMKDPPAGAGSDRPRVAIVAGDPLAVDHAARELLGQLTEHAVPGHAVDVIVGAREAPAGFDLIHLLTDLPASVPGAGVPVVASAATAPDDAELILSPSRAGDQRLIGRGVHPERIARFQRGVDARRYHPARFAPEALPPPAAFDILHVGDDGLELAVDAFGVARDHNPRLRLVHVGARDAHRGSLGSHAVHVPDPSADELATLYASSDLLLVTDPGDAGDGILEAQASGLPVLAVNTGAAPELIANGRDGCLILSDPLSIAAALQGLARRAALLERLATGGLLAVRTRTWDRALEQLAEAYSRALQPALGEIARAA